MKIILKTSAGTPEAQRHGGKTMAYGWAPAHPAGDGQDIGNASISRISLCLGVSVVRNLGLFHTRCDGCHIFLPALV